MENTSIKSTKKKSLSKFNLEEIRGWIIDQMNQTELRIDSIISGYIKPENKHDFEKIILNSSIISIGGKLKILRNIKTFDKRIIEKIGKLSSIRNALAHLHVKETVHINVIIDENGVFKSSEITKITGEIEYMNSSGDLKIKNIKELINEFFELNKELREYFFNYSKK